MAARTYQMSPFGVAVHPWINKPDTKFNELGLYKVGLLLSGPEAIAFKEAIDRAAQEGFDTIMQEMADQSKAFTPGERKKWSLYVPYEEKEDADGNKTGDIEFDFKQNAKIKLRDGSTKDVTIAIKDANNSDMHKPVFGGSVLRTMFAFRPIKMTSSKQAGVRLDFAAVQVRQLGTGAGGGFNFGVVEGGYTEDQEDQEHAAAEGAAAGDY